MMKTVKVNGRERTVVNYYTSGPGTPINSIDLKGGAYLMRIGDTWKLTEPRPLGPVGEVTVEF